MMLFMYLFRDHKVLITKKSNHKRLLFFCCPKGGFTIAIYHCSIKIISRGKGKSAVAAAAYRSGEQLINNYDGITHDYTRKSGIAYTEIMLPSHAPPDFQNRAVLWNSVEKIEKSKNSQLAREIELAIPKELNREQQISLVREYVNDNFVSAGMCADFAIHDKSDGNPHAHIMLTMRPLEQNGEWGAKSKKEYITDKNGERIKLKNGNFKTRKVDTVDWNEQSKAELWRSAWADIANKYLAENSVDERIDHRSFERQGTERIPTIHLGVTASQMERKGIATERGNINREIKTQNKILAEIKAKISALKNWLADLFRQKKDIASPSAEPNPIEIVLQMQGQKQSIWNKVNVLKDTATAVSYLQSNNITTLTQLDEKSKTINSQFNITRKELIGIENKIFDLSEKVKQTDIYLKHREMYKKYVAIPKDKDKRYRLEHISEIVLYEGAIKYLKENLTDNRIYPQEWKSELKSLTEQKQKLYSEYESLKTENKLLGDIKRTVNSALRRQTQKRNIDIER